MNSITLDNLTLENYTIYEWLAFFFIYCFLGWCIESTIVSFNKKKLINRGFLKGPILPLYGSGAVIMLASTLWAKNNFILVYVFGLLSATVLEYITGVVMENMFNMRYWDYSNKKFNIKGQICLTSSLFWGVLAILMVCFVHDHIEIIVKSVSLNTLKIILLIIIMIFLVDAVIAFKNAFDFQRILAYQTVVKRELAEVTERLNDAREAFTESYTEKQIQFFAKQEERAELLKWEVEAAKTKLGKFRYRTFKSFPSATSVKFGEALEEFKEKFKG